LCAVLPRAAGIGKLEIGLVNEVCCGERIRAAGLIQVPVRDSLELLIYYRV
jgi:hypothetical protein